LGGGIVRVVSWLFWLRWKKRQVLFERVVLFLFPASSFLIPIKRSCSAMFFSYSQCSFLLFPARMTLSVAWQEMNNNIFGRGGNLGGERRVARDE